MGWCLRVPELYHFHAYRVPLLLPSPRLSSHSRSPPPNTQIRYTGTQLCADPARKLITVFLTNRVYPSAANEKIAKVRPAFNTAVQKVFDSLQEQGLV